MRRTFGLGRILASLFVLAFVAIVAMLAVAWSSLPLQHATISIDGQTFALSGFDGWHAAATIVAVAVVALIGIIVAALAVVFAIGVALLGVCIALLAVVASVALVASPLLFLGWLIWRIVRPAPTMAAVAA